MAIWWFSTKILENHLWYTADLTLRDPITVPDFCFYRCSLYLCPHPVRHGASEADCPCKGEQDVLWPLLVLHGFSLLLILLGPQDPRGHLRGLGDQFLPPYNSPCLTLQALAGSWFFSRSGKRGEMAPHHSNSCVTSFLLTALCVSCCKLLPQLLTCLGLSLIMSQLRSHLSSQSPQASKAASFSLSTDLLQVLITLLARMLCQLLIVLGTVCFFSSLLSNN